MIRLCLKAVGSDDELQIESLPGEGKENTISQNKDHMFLGCSHLKGFMAQDKWDASM